MKTRLEKLASSGLLSLGPASSHPLPATVCSNRGLMFYQNDYFPVSFQPVINELKSRRIPFSLIGEPNTGDFLNRIVLIDIERRLSHHEWMTLTTTRNSSQHFSTRTKENFDSQMTPVRHNANAIMARPLNTAIYARSIMPNTPSMIELLMDHLSAMMRPLNDRVTAYIRADHLRGVERTKARFFRTWTLFSIAITFISHIIYDILWNQIDLFTFTLYTLISIYLLYFVALIMLDYI